jgi:glycosyltransferase 2 family protein
MNRPEADAQGAPQAKDVCRYRIQRALVSVFAIACLVWVFHDVHPRQLFAAMSIANWGFVMLAISVDILTYILQGIRWKLLLAPVGSLSILRTTQAIYAGLFTNELVPLRFGELVRAFLVSRWLSSRFPPLVPSMVIERCLDAFWLAAGIAVAATLVPVPRYLIKAGEVFGEIVLLAALLFAWMVSRTGKEFQRGDHVSSSRALRALSRFASQLAGGLRDIGLSYRLCLAVLLSAGMLVCQALALWFMMLACRIGLPLAAATIILLVIRLGTALPNAPANVGSFQFFSVLAFNLFGVEKTVAAGFSIVYFLALAIPLWILGLLALSRSDIALSTIRVGVAALRHDAGPA